jgi:photosystem II stability/assembly factor-like uncharacterized protein
VNPQADLTTLFVGTAKGLFRLTDDGARSRWRIDGPHLRGYEVIHTCQAPGEPATVYATARHSVWGAHLYRSRDGGDSWEALAEAPHHASGSWPVSLKAIWHLAAAPDGSALYAGIDPPGLFVSFDDATTWQPLPGFNDHPTRARWEPSKGIFAAHSIQVDPEDPQRLYAAVSAGGVYRSEDGGGTWAPANVGVRAENLPEAAPLAGHNVHRLVMHPSRPSRLYRQCYHGVYRSDDRGASWCEITGDLPSDFGYGIVTDPEDPDLVYLIPEDGPDFRTVSGGRLRVFRSTNAGADWTSVSSGLPPEHAYVTVLREALEIDSHQPRGLYLGTSGGHLFATRDAAASWEMIADFLPRILTVKAHAVDRRRGATVSLPDGGADA